MLSVILSTVLFARGVHYATYKTMPLEQRPDFIRQVAAKHYLEGNLDKFNKWHARFGKNTARIARVKEINSLLANLTEESGRLTQIEQTALEAVANAEQTKLKFTEINASIKLLTEERERLESRMAQQAEQADATAARVEADVTGQSMSTVAESAAPKSHESSTLPNEITVEPESPVMPVPNVSFTELTEMPVTASSTPVEAALPVVEHHDNTKKVEADHTAEVLPPAVS